LIGRVLVDGQPRVPRGLVITLTRPAEQRLHALEARYEIGPVDWLVNELFVTSEETVPQIVATGFTAKARPKDETALDLELSSGVTLRLNVVDPKGGAPLPGVELWLRVDCNPAGATRREPRMFQHHIVTGGDGVAIVTGLPRNAGFSIRRDATLRNRHVEMLPKPPQEIPLPRESLLSETVDAASPAIIERTLRIDAQDRTLHVFGDLDATFLAPGEFGEGEAEIRFATYCDDRRFVVPPELPFDPWMRNLASVPHDDHGHWQFEVEPCVEYHVWVEREHRRISQVATVKAEDGDMGPVALPPRRGTDVVLRLRRCPAEGSFAITVMDVDGTPRMGTQYLAHGGTFERRLRLEGATTIYVLQFLDPTLQRMSTQRRLEVDPATTPVLEVDLAAEEARTVSLVLSAGTLPQKGKLTLSRVGADGTSEQEFFANVDFADGESCVPVSIEPGRYLYWLSATPGGAALVLGVADVARATGGRTLVIRCELEAHPKSDLGAGVDITEVDGVRSSGRSSLLKRPRLASDPSPILQRMRFVDDPSLAAVDTIFLPRGAKFTVLEK